MSGNEPTEPRSRRLLLADADAFFVAVARLDDPEGAGRAPLLIVGGSAEGRGVVTSASYEARIYGVRSAMPMAQALRLCPGATRVPVPRAACVRRSREIRAVLERFTPVVVPASIDEFYLDLSGTEALYRRETLEGTARRIREAVIGETRLAVSFGGGTSRLVAKLAAERAKPAPSGTGSGVYVVPPGGEADFLAEQDLAAIPSIGPAFQQRLAAKGLRRVRDVLPYPETQLVAWFGRGTGRWLHRVARGRDTSSLTRRPHSRSMGHEETFATDIDADEALERELARLAAQVAREVRAHGFRARTVTVKLRDADFTTRQASRTLPQAVAADAPIRRTALSLLRRLRTRRRTPARLLGVSVSGLETDAGGQLALFDAPAPEVETERERTLARTLDTINAQRRRIRTGRELQ